MQAESTLQSNFSLAIMLNSLSQADCTMRSSAGKRTAFATYVWSVKFALTLVAERKGSAIGMQCKKPYRNVAYPHCIVVWTGPSSEWLSSSQSDLILFQQQMGSL